MDEQNQALAAMLMGRDRARARYGRMMAFNVPTTPVRSPLEGLARVLQGGVEGFTAGYFDRQARGAGPAPVSGSTGRSFSAQAGEPAGNTSGRASVMCPGLATLSRNGEPIPQGSRCHKFSRSTARNDEQEKNDTVPPRSASKGYL